MQVLEEASPLLPRKTLLLLLIFRQGATDAGSTGSSVIAAGEKLSFSVSFLDCGNLQSPLPLLLMLLRVVIVVAHSQLRCFLPLFLSSSSSSSFSSGTERETDTLSL